MRIVIVEYVIAGGLAGDPLESALLGEAREMVHGLVQDITQLPEFEVAVAVAVATAETDGLPRIVRRPGEHLKAFWCRAARSGDAVLPLAPETGAALEQLTRLLTGTGVTLIGCRAEAVAVAASKYRTHGLLAAAGIPVVPTYLPREAPGLRAGAWVVKPDDGVSCQGLRWLGGDEALEDLAPGQVVQPWLDGIPASLCLLCDHPDAQPATRVLSCNRQLIQRPDPQQTGGVFHYQGSEVAALAVEPWLRELAARVYQAMPGLYGFVGIDFIMHRHGCTILEINPRLTTSFAGLHRATGTGLGHWIRELLVQHPQCTGART